MTGKVRAIDCEPADADVIAKLEDIMAVAREGRISAVAVAVVYRDGSTGKAWSRPHSIATLLGAVTILRHRLVQHVIAKD